jgi:hypothetical protein
VPQEGVLPLQEQEAAVQHEGVQLQEPPAFRAGKPPAYKTGAPTYDDHVSSVLNMAVICALGLRLCCPRVWQIAVWWKLLAGLAVYSGTMNIRRLLAAGWQEQGRQR